MLSQQPRILFTEDFVLFSKNLSLKYLIYRKYKDRWLYISYLSLSISFILFICGCILIYSVENFVLGLLLALFAWFLFSFSAKYNKRRIEGVIANNPKHKHKIFLTPNCKLDSRTLSRIRTYELSKFIGDSKVDIPFSIKRLQADFLDKINYKFLAFGTLGSFGVAIAGAYLQDIFKGETQEQHTITLQLLLAIAFLISLVVLLLEIFAKELIGIKESRIKLLIKHLDEVYQIHQQDSNRLQ